MFTAVFAGLSACQQVPDVDGASGSTGTSQIAIASSAGSQQAPAAGEFLEPRLYRGMWNLAVRESAKGCLINLTDVKSDTGFYHVQTFGCPDGFGRIQQWGAYAGGIIVADAAGSTLVDFKGVRTNYTGSVNLSDGRSETVKLTKQ
ncbi:MAG: AprI/Inh family metalloprotease inhibitor [Stappiaceae bacterium]